MEAKWKLSFSYVFGSFSFIYKYQRFLPFVLGGSLAHSRRTRFFFSLASGNLCEVRVKRRAAFILYLSRRRPVEPLTQQVHWLVAILPQTLPGPLGFQSINHSFFPAMLQPNGLRQGLFLHSRSKLANRGFSGFCIFLDPRSTDGCPLETTIVLVLLRSPEKFMCFSFIPFLQISCRPQVPSNDLLNVAALRTREGHSVLPTVFLLVGEATAFANLLGFSCRSHGSYSR